MGANGDQCSASCQVLVQLVLQVNEGSIVLRCELDSAQDSARDKRSNALDLQRKAMALASIAPSLTCPALTLSLALSSIISAGCDSLSLGCGILPRNTSRALEIPS